MDVSMDQYDHRLFAVEQFRNFICLIETGWHQLHGALEPLSIEEIESPGTCGEWSVRDLIAHLTSWDTIAVGKVQTIVDDSNSDTMETTQQFNERAIQESLGLSIARLMSNFATRHRTLLDALHAATGQSGEILERIEWTVGEDTWKHYEIHRSQIQSRFTRIR